MDPLISPRALEEFRTIWRKEFGEELSEERAKIEAEALVRTVQMIFTVSARIESSQAPQPSEIRQPVIRMLSNEHEGVV